MENHSKRQTESETADGERSERKVRGEERKNEDNVTTSPLTTVTTRGEQHTSTRNISQQFTFSTRTEVSTL